MSDGWRQYFKFINEPEKDGQTYMNNFDVFRTTDGSVTKYIHEDGSETAIKKVLSEQNVINPITRQLETHKSERQKYSVFISCSVGCHMKCGFCHLTLKNAKYSKLGAYEILSNLKEALLDAVAFDPDLKNRYIKLSWMGMGDALNMPITVASVTTDFLDWVFTNGFAKGLDGVDLSTVMPKVNPRWIGIFHKLELDLGKYSKNPVNISDQSAYSTVLTKKRNIFRLFFSLGSPIQSIRDKIIPNASPLLTAIENIKLYEEGGKYSVIIHHLLVEGLNDSPDEIDALISLFRNSLKDNELRLLRYNSCLDKTMKESDQITKHITALSKEIKFLKVQISPGSEVSAACGQFIVKKYKE